jgi:hypothetical protein
MWGAMRASGITATCLLAGGLAGQVRAQVAAPVVYIGGSFQIGQATGQFADYVNLGWGAGGYVLYRPRGGPLGIRLGGMYLVYGSQTHRYPLVPGIAVDVTTRNQIAQFSLGPQLTLGRGAVRVYGFGTIGGSVFWTNSSVAGSDGNTQPFASTTNYQDGTLSAEIGGGCQVLLASRHVPIYADFGVRYLNNGRVTYVTRDGVTIDGNQLLVDPVDSKANLVVYHVGVTVGLPRRRGP